MKIKSVVAASAAALSISLVCAPLSSASPEDFQRCLKAHGVNAPLPKNPPPPPKDGSHKAPPAPPGVDQDTWNDAFKACHQFAPKPPRHHK